MPIVAASPCGPHPPPFESPDPPAFISGFNGAPVNLTRFSSPPLPFSLLLPHKLFFMSPLLLFFVGRPPRLSALLRSRSALLGQTKSDEDAASVSGGAACLRLLAGRKFKDRERRGCLGRRRTERGREIWNADLGTPACQASSQLYYLFERYDRSFGSLGADQRGHPDGTWEMASSLLTAPPFTRRDNSTRSGRWVSLERLRARGHKVEDDPAIISLGACEKGGFGILGTISTQLISIDTRAAHEPWQESVSEQRIISDKCWRTRANTSATAVLQQGQRLRVQFLARGETPPRPVGATQTQHKGIAKMSQTVLMHVFDKFVCYFHI